MWPLREIYAATVCPWKRWLAGTNKQQETVMPVLLVPLLVGTPIVLGGGYLIYRVIAGWHSRALNGGFQANVHPFELILNSI
jgi:hypothetical protein